MEKSKEGEHNKKDLYLKKPFYRLMVTCGSNSSSQKLCYCLPLHAEILNIYLQDCLHLQTPRLQRTGSVSEGSRLKSIRPSLPPPPTFSPFSFLFGKEAAFLLLSGQIYPIRDLKPSHLFHLSHSEAHLPQASLRLKGPLLG